MNQNFQKLEEKLLEPATRKSPEDLASLLADEFIEFGSSGEIYTKQQVIYGLLKESQISFSPTDFKQLQLAPNVVLVTYRVAKYKNSNEKPIYSLRSSIWKFIDNRWQMVFHQGTNIKNL